MASPALEPRDTSLCVGTTCKWCRSLATVTQMAARIFMSFYLWSTYLALPGWLLLAYAPLGFPTDSLSGNFHHTLPPTSLLTPPPICPFPKSLSAVPNASPLHKLCIAALLAHISKAHREQGL